MIELTDILNIIEFLKENQWLADFVLFPLLIMGYKFVVRFNHMIDTIDKIKDDIEELKNKKK